MSHDDEHPASMPDMVLRDRDHREVSQVVASLADFLCWAAGHNAALHLDEKADRGIIGVHHVRRARELLGHLVVINASVPRTKSAEPAGLWITDPLELDVLAMLRVGIEQRRTGDPARSGDEIHIVVRPDGPVTFESPPKPARARGIPVDWAAEPDRMLDALNRYPALSVDDLISLWNTGRRAEGPRDDDPAGWAAPGWVSGPRAMFETAAECAEHMRLVGNDDPRGPLPMYDQPRGAPKPADGIVGWVVRSRQGDDKALLNTHAAAVEWHKADPDTWDQPVPVYEQPQPKLEPDWPREVTVSMAESYGETLSLALQDGADHPGAAKAVLVEFMASHRPAERVWAVPPGHRIVPDVITADMNAAAFAEADKLVPNETAAEHNARCYAATVKAAPALPTAPVEADFAEVPHSYYVQGVGSWWYFKHREDAERCAKNNTSQPVVPLYAAPHPAVLPQGWTLMPDKPTHAMVMGTRTTLKMTRGPLDDDEAMIKRLYDAFVINRPSLPR